MPEKIFASMVQTLKADTLAVNMRDNYKEVVYNKKEDSLDIKGFKMES
jgi:hypothetical protein